MNLFWYLVLMAVPTYLIRMIPFVLFEKEIKSPFVKSFLHYVPYTVLSAMTFPAIFYSTGSELSAACGCLIAVILAFKNKNLTIVAISAAAVALIVSFI